MSYRSLVRRGLLPAMTLALGGALATPALANCPDWNLDGIYMNMDADLAWTPQRFALITTGALSLSQCPQIPGTGYMNAAPNFTINYDDRGMGRALDFRLESSCDTVMLVNDAQAQWHFNDDADGTLNARLRLDPAGSGIYDVWVGTFSQQSCPVTLVVETFPGSAPAASACPDWSLGGAEVSLRSGGREERAVVAGGSISLSGNACGIDGWGHVAAAPDFSVTVSGLSGVASFVASARGDCDTVMLINDPFQNWHFNDDSDGLHPAIEIGDAAEGRYDVWIGTFGSSLCNATATFSVVPVGGGAPAATK